MGKESVEACYQRNEQCENEKMFHIIIHQGMQIKTTVRYHFMHFRVTRIKSQIRKKCCWRYREIRTLIHCWWGGKVVWPLWKVSFPKGVPQTVKYRVRAIIPIGLYPGEILIYIHTKTYTWLFVAVLFVIAKRWN